MQEGGDLKGDQERRELFARAMKRPDRVENRDRDDPRAPDRGIRKAPRTGRK